MAEQKPVAGELDKQLMGWAAEYASNESNKLLALGYNPAEYPGQKGHVVHADSEDKSLVKLIASEAFKPQSFDRLLELLDEPLQVERLHATGELLAGGNSVVLATNHGDLIDIAIAHAAVYHQLAELGYSPRTGIVISKMVAFLAYEFLGEAIPCTKVLQNLEDEIYLSYPRTASAEQHGISKFIPDVISDPIETHNRHMRKDIAKALGGGSMLLAVAMSGTTDKSFGHNNELHMAPVTEGTARMLRQEHTYILPTALYYKDQPEHIAICETPLVIKNIDTLHTAMEDIAQNLTNGVSGIHYTYGPPAAG